MINELHKKFKEVAFLYKLWFHFKKSKLSDVRLPKSSDHFYLDGFPRSGNSYADYFLRNFYPHLEYSHHLHTIAAIKIALKKGVTPIIAIRNPLDSIASFSIMRSYYGKGSLNNNSLINNISNEYIDYYQFVYDNLDKIKILPFVIITNLEALNNFFNENINCIKKIYSVDELNTFHENFIKMQRAKPSDRTSTPNENRNSKKKLVKAKILKLDSYQEANSLYLKIVNESKST